MEREGGRKWERGRKSEREIKRKEVERDKKEGS